MKMHFLDGTATAARAVYADATGISGGSEVYCSVKEASKYEPFGTTTIYELINSGRIRAKKFGSKTMPYKADFRALIESLPDYRRPAAAAISSSKEAA